MIRLAACHPCGCSLHGRFVGFSTRCGHAPNLESDLLVLSTLTQIMAISTDAVPTLQVTRFDGELVALFFVSVAEACVVVLCLTKWLQFV
jgi:hypothetical protein